MQLTILGTATLFPVPGNACSGYLLRSEHTALWIDAGSGTFAELQRHLTLGELDGIWISHRHADHSADLLVAYYAYAFSAFRPSRRVPVIGPEGLADRLATYLGPTAVSGLHDVFEFVEMSGWGDKTIGDLLLSWGPVAHGVPAFALTVGVSVGVSAGGRVGGSAAETGHAGARTAFTYSGDTGPCTSLIEMAEESGTLLSEVGYQREMLGEEAVHLTPEDAGRAAAAAGVERLVLTHVAEGMSGAEAARRASGTYAGVVEVAEPGAVFTV